eukprot:6629579-Prymnesium_polylepis.1
MAHASYGHKNKPVHTVLPGPMFVHQWRQNRTDAVGYVSALSMAAGPLQQCAGRIAQTHTIAGGTADVLHAVPSDT